MKKKFLMVRTYKSLISKPFQLGKITFTPSIIINIVIFSSGGGCGFTPIESYEIILNDGETSNRYNETCGAGETPIYNFITHNAGALFELSS